MKISCRILLRMRNVSDKVCKENHKTHFYVQCSENDAAYEIMWKYLVETGVSIIWCIKNEICMPDN
jgi:hypothetical protein